MPNNEQTNHTHEQLAAAFPMVSPILHLRITTTTGRTVGVLKLARRDYSTGDTTEPGNLSVQVETLPGRSSSRTSNNRGWLATDDTNPSRIQRSGYRVPAIHIDGDTITFPKWKTSLTKALPALAKLYDQNVSEVQERHLQAFTHGQR